jgi:hypothetical protein
LAKEELGLLAEVYETERQQFVDHADLAQQIIGEYPVADVPPAETAAWISVARTVMNLDEFITRE